MTKLEIGLIILIIIILISLVTNITSFVNKKFSIFNILFLVIATGVVYAIMYKMHNNKTNKIQKNNIEQDYWLPPIPRINTTKSYGKLTDDELSCMFENLDKEPGKEVELNKCIELKNLQKMMSV